mmetsp:Transcript_74861/g.148346  ORF Transcript_74861/g.148346 Transcript_74861/m.148346 type:complete len:136 (+) Transcript_74861:56-463(+)|eukprot:CAMPEP_0172722826 /NCGR_PEP_ID=MMETSP1074-20121228/82403_1 /TAXON_ID=2916 /ORGANISM="Ceratium fusus, Strain PA161109" /LENGTH=135 /DNA_ID=CAMNT_0013548915 /DNA_START=45 /DNA_END=452 /DNA_ORIENTATION=+
MDVFAAGTLHDNIKHAASQRAAHELLRLAFHPTMQQGQTDWIPTAASAASFLLACRFLPELAFVIPTVATATSLPVLILTHPTSTRAGACDTYCGYGHVVLSAVSTTSCRLAGTRAGIRGTWQMLLPATLLSSRA